MSYSILPDYAKYGKYKLETVPSRGELILNGTVLTIGSIFTQEDINSGALSYKHNKIETDVGTVYDMFNFSILYMNTPITQNSPIRSTCLPIPAIDIPINGFYQFPITIILFPYPEEIKNSSLELFEGSSEIITSDNLEWGNTGSLPSQIIYSITSITGGIILKNGEEVEIGETFSQQDINLGLIEFSAFEGAPINSKISFNVCNQKNKCKQGSLNIKVKEIFRFDGDNVFYFTPCSIINFNWRVKNYEKVGSIYFTVISSSLDILSDKNPMTGNTFDFYGISANGQPVPSYENIEYKCGSYAYGLFSQPYPEDDSCNYFLYKRIRRNKTTGAEGISYVAQTGGPDAIGTCNTTGVGSIWDGKTIDYPTETWIYELVANFPQKYYTMTNNQINGAGFIFTTWTSSTPIGYGTLSLYRGGDQSDVGNRFKTMMFGPEDPTQIDFEIKATDVHLNKEAIRKFRIIINETGTSSTGKTSEFNPNI